MVHMEHERGAFKVNRAAFPGEVKKPDENPRFGGFSVSGRRLHRKKITAGNLVKLANLHNNCTGCRLSIHSCGLNIRQKFSLNRRAAPDYEAKPSA